jgi:hypothetical protein
MNPLEELFALEVEFFRHVERQVKLPLASVCEWYMILTQCR